MMATTHDQASCLVLVALLRCIYIHSFFSSAGVEGTEVHDPMIAPALLLFFFFFFATKI
jgi:hypothetical protein